MTTPSRREFLKSSLALGALAAWPRTVSQAAPALPRNRLGMFVYLDGREPDEARVAAFKQASEFARQCGIPAFETHCGFIPDNPNDPLYKETVAAVRDVAGHPVCGPVKRPTCC